MHLKPTEKEPRSRGRRPADRHLRRRRRQSLQFRGSAGRPTISRSRANSTSICAATSRPRRAPNRLRAAYRFLRRRGQQGCPAVPDDPRNHAYEGVHDGAQRHGQAAVFGRSHQAQPEIVDQYFNTSTGTGDQGEEDLLAPWNEGDDVERVDAPAFQQLVNFIRNRRARSSTEGLELHHRRRTPTPAQLDHTLQGAKHRHGSREKRGC